MVFLKQDRDCLRVCFRLVVGQEDGVFPARDLRLDPSQMLFPNDPGMLDVNERADEVQPKFVIVEGMAHFAVIGLKQMRGVDLLDDELKKEAEDRQMRFKRLSASFERFSVAAQKIEGDLAIFLWETALFLELELLLDERLFRCR